MVQDNETFTGAWQSCIWMLRKDLVGVCATQLWPICVGHILSWPYPATAFIGMVFIIMDCIVMVHENLVGVCAFAPRVRICLCACIFVVTGARLHAQCMVRCIAPCQQASLVLDTLLSTRLAGQSGPWLPWCGVSRHTAPCHAVPRRTVPCKCARVCVVAHSRACSHVPVHLLAP